jgi:hypothetical protein
MSNEQAPCVECGDPRTDRKDRPDATGLCLRCFNATKPAPRHRSCPGCGMVRQTKPSRSQRPNHTGLCRACWRQTLRGVPTEPPDDEDESPLDLAETPGRWVLERGIRVWREDVAA